MSEFERESRAIQVCQSCEHCDEGQMMATGMVLTSFPAQYPHVCDDCGHKETYKNSYPFIKYKAINA